MYKLNTSSYSPSLSPLLPSLGQFEKGVAEGAVDSSFNPVVALRLSVIKDSAVWAILSEVSQSHSVICLYLLSNVSIVLCTQGNVILYNDRCMCVTCLCSSVCLCRST